MPDRNGTTSANIITIVSTTLVTDNIVTDKYPRVFRNKTSYTKTVTMRFLNST